MDKVDFSSLTDDELLVEKKKLKNSRMIAATLIGFLAGILLFGTVSWALSSEKQIGFLIPMLIPVFAIYKLMKNPKSEEHQQLEQLLKERNLD
ncbi:MAG: hypothetical protein AAFQ94_02380 [Bacteroidota bacterium]